MSPIQTRSEARTFVYQPRGADAVQRRATQQGGAFDSIFKSSCTVFAPKEGDYDIRFCPPTWDNPDHYAIEVWIHYNVGPDNATYLCLNKMLGQPCPMCDERKRAEQAGDADYAKSLAPQKRCPTYLIDRKAEAQGPQVWGMPWTFDKEVAGLSIDKRSGAALLLDNPDQGYDVSFNKAGVKKNTKYTQIQIARNPTYLCDDEQMQNAWIQFLMENPLPDMLQYFDYNYIQSIFTTAPREQEQPGQEQPLGRGRSRVAENQSETQMGSRRRSSVAQSDPQQVQQPAFSSRRGAAPTAAPTCIQPRGGVPAPIASNQPYGSVAGEANDWSPYEEDNVPFDVPNSAQQAYQQAAIPQQVHPQAQQPGGFRGRVQAATRMTRG